MVKEKKGFTTRFIETHYRMQFTVQKQGQARSDFGLFTRRFRGQVTFLEFAKSRVPSSISRRVIFGLGGT